MEIKIGDIYFNDLHKNEVLGIPAEKFHFFYRILFYNENFFSSEIWENDLQKGRISMYGKKPAIYGRSPLSLLERCKYIKNVPLTEEEKKVAFIDKPIDLLPELNDYIWTSEKIINENELLQTLSEGNKQLLFTFSKIELKSFILLPFNSRDSFGKAVKLDAANGEFFTSTELLVKIHNEQSNYLKANQTFAFKGVSRAGHQKNLPSYSVRKE